MVNCGCRCNETRNLYFQLHYCVWMQILLSNFDTKSCHLILTLIKVSVSNNGHVWAVDQREKIWYRKGANNQTILGSNWKSISGNLKQVNSNLCTLNLRSLLVVSNIVH